MLGGNLGSLLYGDVSVMLCVEAGIITVKLLHISHFKKAPSFLFQKIAAKIWRSNTKDSKKVKKKCVIDKHVY